MRPIRIVVPKVADPSPLTRLPIPAARGPAALSARAARLPSLPVLRKLPSRQLHGVFVTLIEEVVEHQVQTTDVLVGE
jgi:hypothetical protein